MTNDLPIHVGDVRNDKVANGSALKVYRSDKVVAIVAKRGELSVTTPRMKPDDVRALINLLTEACAAIDGDGGA